MGHESTSAVGAQTRRSANLGKLQSPAQRLAEVWARALGGAESVTVEGGHGAVAPRTGFPAPVD